MNISARQLLAGAALVLAVCSFFITAYPLIQVSVILLAVATLL